MAITIKIKRGNKANLPALAVGEPAFCLDTNELYVGTAGGNKLVGDGIYVKKSGDTMTGQLTLPGNPTQANHAATKAYVDALAMGLDLKPSVRVRAGGNVSIITPPGAIDGVTLNDGDRVLLTEQTDKTQNGIWEFEGEGEAMDRPNDFVTGRVTSGTFVFVEEGTSAGAGFILTTPDPITIGTTQLTFTRFSGTSYSAGNGLLLTGTSFSVKAYNGINVDANGVSVKPYNGISVSANGVSVAAADATINVSASGVKVGVIGSANIASGAVGSVQLASQCVTAAKLGAVAGTGLSGGSGSALSVNFGTTAGTVCQGNDSRLHNQNTDAGTSNATFYIGSGGVKIKTVSSALVARDNADGAYAPVGGLSFQVLNNANSYKASIIGTVTADRTLTVPDTSGTILTDNSTVDGGTF